MTINQEIVETVQLSTDGKGFKRVGNAHTPWDSTSDFLTNMPTTRRHEGMFGYIRNGSDIEIWHFVGNITDESFVKYALSTITSIDTEHVYSDFPTVGVSNMLYVDSSTYIPYFWDGSEYQLIGNPGPTGAKGDTGATGAANSLSIGSVTSGDTASASITGDAPSQTLNLVLEKGDTGADGADGSAITVRTNGSNNDVQDVLDLIDSDTIEPDYAGTGQVKLNVIAPIPAGGTTGQVLAKNSGTDYDIKWEDQSGGGSGSGSEMVYPGAGIPLSTGSAWGTSITDNSANWNTAYGWGNHASAGYLTSSSSLAWANITGAPTTLSGYGIADAYPLTGNPSGFLTSVPAQAWSSITSKPTTISGYGITDAGTVSNGGTGLTSFSTGDILYASATNTLSALSAGTNGYILTLASGIPSWAAGSSLPSQSGNTGKFLTTNGTSTSWGTLSFTPAGSDTQIQFNNSGVLTASAELSYDYTNHRLLIGTTSTSSSYPLIIRSLNYPGIIFQYGSETGTTGAFILFDAASSHNLVYSNPISGGLHYFSQGIFSSIFYGGFFQSQLVSGTNINGNTTYFQGGVGTGTGTPGSLIFSVSKTGTSGTSQQSTFRSLSIMGNTGNIQLGNNGSLTGYSENGNILSIWGTSTIISNTGSSPASANACAILQLDSTTQGFLTPRLITAQKNAISSLVAGLFLYDSTLNKLCVYTGSAWETITSS